MGVSSVHVQEQMGPVGIKPMSKLSRVRSWKLHQYNQEHMVPATCADQGKTSISCLQWGLGILQASKKGRAFSGYLALPAFSLGGRQVLLGT